MEDKLTYEKALEIITTSCVYTHAHEYRKYDSGTIYENKNHIITKHWVSSFDYQALKKLEEAIEKAKKYDLLAKEEN